MNINWNAKEPIYRQLYERLVEIILDEIVAEGEALPSIRDISTQHRINHITVAKSFQMLVDEDLIEKKRGIGMFVKAGAKEKMLSKQRTEFLNEEWPSVCSKIKRIRL